MCSDLGVHIDGYVALVATSVVVGETEVLAPPPYLSEVACRVKPAFMFLASTMYPRLILRASGCRLCLQ